MRAIAITTILFIASTIFFTPLFASNYTYSPIRYPGAIATAPWSVNNKGQVTGEYANAPGDGRAFLFDGTNYIDIPIAGSLYTRGEGINNHGEVAGVYRDAAGKLHGFIYRNGQVETYDVRVATAVGTVLTGISDTGVLTGNYHESSGYSFGFIDDHGTVTTIPLDLTTDINDNGRVTGVKFIDWRAHAYFYENGEARPVPLPENTYSAASGVNAHGHIAGDYWPDERRGFLYDGTQVITFDYPGTEDTHGTALTDVNDEGVVVGGYFDEQNTYGFIAKPIKTGSVTRDFWRDIPGASVSDLTRHPSYPNNPSGSEALSKLQGPSDWADNYGSRIRGYVHAPATGNYIFGIGADDHGELYLSTDENPANKRLIASAKHRQLPKRWDKHGGPISAPVLLEAGKRYYIEVLHKEARAHDGVAVGWQLPNGTLEFPIPGNRLSPAQ